MRRALTRPAFSVALWLVSAAVVGVACGTAPSPDGRSDPGTTTDCVSCHRAEYQAAKRPLHVGVKPTTCAVCHTSAAWSPSVFNHPWPLTGAHANAACKGCHVGDPPRYAGTGRLCIDCHRDDYQSSTYPGHAHFATTCTDCHTTTAWTPAHVPAPVHDELTGKVVSNQHGRVVVHEPSGAKAPAHQPARRPAPSVPIVQEPAAPATPSVAPAPPPQATRQHPENRFPIASGSHADIECRTCHDQGGVMGKGNTDCVQCHARSRFDRRHDGVDGYPTGSAPPNFCVQCHTRGTRSRG